MFALNPENGKFRNFLIFSGHGLNRAARTTVTAEQSGHWEPFGKVKFTIAQNLAGKLFEQALPNIISMTSPRACHLLCLALMNIHKICR